MEYLAAAFCYLPFFTFFAVVVIQDRKHQKKIEKSLPSELTRQFNLL